METDIAQGTAASNATADITQQNVLLIVPEVQITLHPGERYAGLALSAEGLISHHVILLAGDAEELDWEAAKAWAAEQGGELPTRQEQSLLFANLKTEFQPEWYWSGQQHERYGSDAWGQDFSYGTQTSDGKSFQARARAVRRLPA